MKKKIIVIALFSKLQKNRKILFLETRNKEVNMQNKKDFPVLLALILAIVIINLLIPKNLEATIYGSISGQVFTEDTGKGLKDVKVYLFEQNSGRYPDEKTTDKKGRFSFDLVEEGEYILAFITDWHTGYYIDIDAKRYIPGKEIIKLKKGQHIEVKIKALLGGAIRARLRKRDGTLFVPPRGKNVGKY